MPEELRSEERANGLRIEAPMSRPHPLLVLATLISTVGLTLVFTIRPPCIFMLLGPIGSWLLIAMGALLVGLVVWLTVGTRRIIAKPGKLVVRYAIGPLAMRSSFTPETATRLVLREAAASALLGAEPRAYRLEVHPVRETEGRTTLLEHDDPFELLDAATEVSERCGIALEVTDHVALATRTSEPVPAARTLELDPRAFPDPPPGAGCWLEAEPGHIALLAEQGPGGRARARRLMLMAALSFVGAVLVPWLPIVLSNRSPLGGPPAFAAAGPWIAVPGLALFGLLLTVGGIRLRRARWILDLSHDGITFIHSGVRGERMRHLELALVRDVRIGESVRERAFSQDQEEEDQERGDDEVQVITHRGPWIRLMAGCDHAALRWARDVLRVALRVGEEPPDGGEEPA